MTEQHPLKHSTDSLHWRRRKRALPAPEHPCGFSLCFALPSGHNKSTLRAFITQSLSFDSSPRDTGGEYGHSTSEESPTNDLLHLTFVFVVFLVLIVPGERSSPTTWTKSSSGSLRLASGSNRSLSTLPPVKERRSRGLQSFVLPDRCYGTTVPLPDPRVQAVKLLPKMTPHDDVEAYLQMFETTATSKGWHPDDWAWALAPLLTGEAQRAYFALPAASASQYVEVKKEILAHLGLSPICAAQYFHEWEYKPRLPARTQAAKLMRLAQHWLLEGSLSASQVAERVVVDRFLRALLRSHRQAVGMRSPTTTSELVEAIELADAAQQRDAGERAPPFPPEGGPGATHAGKHPATTEQDGASLSAGRAHADRGSHGSRLDLAGRMHCAPRPNRWGSRSGRED